MHCQNYECNLVTTKALKGINQAWWIENQENYKKVYHFSTSNFNIFLFAIWVKMFGLKIIFEIIEIINEL
jgi:hypothetical protein